MPGREGKYSLIAVVLAISAGLLTFAYLQSVKGSEAKIIQAKLATFENKKKVVVARKNISAGAIIADDDVYSANIMAAYVVPGALKKIDDVVGQNALVDVYEGEQIAKGRIGSQEGAQTASRTISKGKLVIAVAVDDISGVSGGIKPGDRVDVLVTYENGVQSDLLYTDLLVRGVGGTYPYGGTSPTESKQGQGSAGFSSGETSSKSNAPTTVVLEVTGEQARQLTFASEKGKIRLALLPAKGD